MNDFVKGLLQGAFVGLLLGLVACEHKVTEYPAVAQMTKSASRDRVVLYPIWVTDVDKIAEKCEKPDVLHYGCATPEQLGPDNYACRIYVQKPKDFNDVPRLAVIGHEVIHCLGAEHK